MKHNGQITQLCLGVQKDEPVYIGQDIVVSVAKIRSNQVKLCIIAPREVEILRQKVKDRNVGQLVDIKA